MDMTLKSLSVLLSYPLPELKESTGEIRRVFESDRRLDSKTKRSLAGLLEEMEQGDIWQLQEQFVEIFDRSRSCCLNLFEHVHGDSRARGSAMLDLLETYRRAGFEPNTVDLPDHLPTVLEFLSLRPPEESVRTLADASHILQAIGVRLTRRNLTYASVFDALVRIAGGVRDGETLEALLKMPDRAEDDLEALDAAWEESEVTFGASPGGDCPQARDMLSRMQPGS
ncbi:MAG: nitrate reductase molybdenum cofactor assembly chaperone [Rhodobacteraceae bacterium]|nr:nitrate reductase molybdenum cofactor assembly chaperone [Paracoccaceae bacterium]